MHAEITEERVRRLLFLLCSQYGYCDASYQLPRFVRAASDGVDAFTDLVIWVEGIDPKLDPGHGRGIREVVAAHFASWMVLDRELDPFK